MFTKSLNLLAFERDVVSGSVKNADELSACLNRHKISPDEGKEHLTRLGVELEQKGIKLGLAANSLRGMADSMEVLKNISSRSWRECINVIEARFPTIFNACYPRRFVLPNGFASPKRIVCPVLACLWMLCEFRDEEFSDIPGNGRVENRYSSHVYRIISSLTRLQVPTYFANHQIMEALINTDLPRDFEMRDVPWPLDAMIFAIPEGVLKSPSGSITAIAIAKIESGREIKLPWFSWDSDHLNKICTIAPIPAQDHDSVLILGITDECQLYHWEAPLDSASIHDASNVKVFSESILCTDDSDGSETDHQFASKNLPKTAFQILLAMLAAPEMIEAGLCVRQAKHKKGKTQSALWSPNFFGRSYRRYDEIVGESSERGKCRMHWRRGHFRHQRFGPGKKAIRVLWIKPVLVGK